MLAMSQMGGRRRGRCGASPVVPGATWFGRRGSEDTVRALLVFESMFGNTERVAASVAQGLGRRLEVTTANAAHGAVPDPAGFDLLVVGAPTHALTLPVPDTRRQAASQADTADIVPDRGVREFLQALPAGDDRPVATFDTRHRKMRYLPGSAARAAVRLLDKAGWRTLVPPQNFYVGGMAGPLLPGELDRAEDWGEQLGRLAVLTGPPPHIARS
jgi:hypothetical protein